MWSGFELGKNEYGTIKKFIEITYNALKSESIYKYFGDYQKIYQKHLERDKQAKREYCERILEEKQGNEEYFKILNMKLAREKRQEKRQERETEKAIEKQRKKRVKEYRAVAKAMAMNLNPNPKIDREKLLDVAYIIVSELYRIDRQDEVFNALFGKEKEKEGGNEMARRDKSEDYRNQLKLFKSREELEKEERISKRKQWLDMMEDFFTPDVNEVRQEISARKERVKELRKTTELMLRSEKEYITGTKIKVICLNVLNWLSVTRLNRNICLKWLEFASKMITEIRLGLSFKAIRVQERKYERGKREKEKEVNRPPPKKFKK